MSDKKTFSLDAYRLGLRAEVLERYHKLKGAGVGEESARNTAAAQASVYGKIKPRPAAHVFRRELDAALKPRPRPRDPGGGTRPPFVDNWQLPT